MIRSRREPVEEVLGKKGVFGGTIEELIEGLEEREAEGRGQRDTQGFKEEAQGGFFFLPRDVGGKGFGGFFLDGKGRVAQKAEEEVRDLWRTRLDLKGDLQGCESEFGGGGLGGEIADQREKRRLLGMELMEGGEGGKAAFFGGRVVGDDRAQGFRGFREREGKKERSEFFEGLVSGRTEARGKLCDDALPRGRRRPSGVALRRGGLELGIGDLAGVEAKGGGDGLGRKANVFGGRGVVSEGLEGFFRFVANDGVRVFLEEMEGGQGRRALEAAEAFGDGFPNVRVFVAADRAQIVKQVTVVFGRLEALDQGV